MNRNSNVNGLGHTTVAEMRDTVDPEVVATINVKEVPGHPKPYYSVSFMREWFEYGKHRQSPWLKPKNLPAMERLRKQVVVWFETKGLAVEGLNAS